MRADGASLQDIASTLSISRSAAFHWTRHVKEQVETPSPAQKRLRAAEAQELRRAGMPYKEIAKRLAVSPSTAYSWTHRVEPVVPPANRGGRSPAEMREMDRRRWAVALRQREQERQQAKLAAARAVGELPPSLLAVAASVAYWCEGGRSKPWARRELLQFVNSDAVLLRLFLAWLRSEGVTDDRIRLRLSIHETADVALAEASWAGGARRVPGEVRAGHPEATQAAHQPQEP